MNPDIKELLEFKPESWRALQRIQKIKSSAESLQSSTDSYFAFNDEEQEVLRSLQNQEYLIDREMKPIIYLGLVDLLFAYSYDHRTTMGESTVESCWTICKLSGTLCAFDQFKSLKDVIICCLRRSITFPLYRAFELSLKVFEDVVVLLKLGRRAVLKAMIAFRQLTRSNEQMFLFDRIFITDYLIWLQSSCSDKILKSLASELHHFKFTKSLISDWDLENLEQESLIRKEQEENEGET